MAIEIFYSALHWAKKADRSATRAANSARTAQTAAAQASQASGKIVQLGFDGAIEDGKLVFKHAPSGVEVPYQLLDDYEYEVDMLYNSTEELSSDLPMVIKNGPDTITFVSALHRSADEPATIGDMKAVMRYNSDTGYRWLFKAAYKVTTSGDKVFLLYPVVASEEVINSKITNCITEIPQDIKLELNNGVLTLKAGSKVYVPNGFEADGTTPKFDEVIMDSNKTYTLDYLTSEKIVLMWSPNYQSLTTERLAIMSSGTTAGYHDQYGTWYDTNSNIVKYTTDNASTWLSKRSFPIAVVNSDGAGTITSIDQIFNGFGYIGSTVYALPGVKGLIPNGRNSDGSLKNAEFVSSKVAVRSDISPNTSGFFALNGIVDGFIDWGTSYELTNDNYLNTTYGNKVSNVVSGLFVTDSNGVITSFNPKQPFRALDYNDRETVVGWGIPDYSAGIAIASLPYTAPTDGVVDIMCSVSNSSAYIKINDVQFSIIDSNAAIYAQKRFAVKKNDRISIGSPFNGAFHTECRGAISAFYPFKGAN